ECLDPKGRVRWDRLVLVIMIVMMAGLAAPDQRLGRERARGGDEFASSRFHEGSCPVGGSLAGRRDSSITIPRAGDCVTSPLVPIRTRDRFRPDDLRLDRARC